MSKKYIQLEKILLELMEGTKEHNHGLKTKEWLLKLSPDADNELQIAALAHDIERAVEGLQGLNAPKLKRGEVEDYYEYKQRHADRSAKIVKFLMEKNGFTKEEVNRVKNAISKHEFGGDKDSNLVRDADSIRYFEDGLPRYTKSYGVDSAKVKGEFMYIRCSDKAKDLIINIDFNSEVKKHLEKFLF